jgi:hypothetical protein
MKKITLGAALCILFFAANIFAQPTWTPQSSPITTDLNSASAVNADICWMSGVSGTSTSNVIRTTNGGQTWTVVSSSIPGANDFYNLFAIDENKCIVGAGDGAIWSTTNGGTNWILDTLSGGSAIFINVVHMFDNNNGFAQGDPVLNVWRYYTTTDGGFHWTLGANAPASAGSEAGWNNSYDAIDTGHIWWGTNVTKIWRGGLYGPFTSTSYSGSNAYCFGVAFNNANTGVAAVVTTGSVPGPIQITTNGGVSWSAGSFTPAQTPFGLKCVHGTGYMWMSCGTTTTGLIYRSTNNGASWTQQLSMSYAGYALTFPNINVGWCGTAGGHIYKYTDNVGVVNQNNTPAQYSLKQNYPNPFNPITTIDYSLAKSGYVSLKVYNVLGENVATLVDGVENAGEHNVNLNAANLPSGTYFYTLRSGDFTATKRLVLVK